MKKFYFVCGFVILFALTSCASTKGEVSSPRSYTGIRAMEEHEVPDEESNYYSVPDVDYVPSEEFLTQFQEGNNDTASVSKSALVRGINESNEIVVTGKEDFDNAVVKFRFIPGKRYQVYMTPGSLTGITLAPDDEKSTVILADSNSWDVLEPVEGGDGKKTSLTFYIRPKYEGIITDCDIITNKRTYYLRLFSSKDTAMTGVRFVYPENAVTYTKTGQLRGKTSVSSGATDYWLVDATKLNYMYEIKGTKDWTPLLAYSDGEKTYIQFADDYNKTDLSPTVFLRENGNEIEITNFDLRGSVYCIPLILTEDQSLVFVNGTDSAIVMRKY